MDSYCSTVLPNQTVLSMNTQKILLHIYFFFFLLQIKYSSHFVMRRNLLPSYRNIPGINFLVRLK